MAAPDRLQELLRQRALLQEHLAWLDREITAASEDTPPPAPTPVARATQQSLVIPAPITPPTPTILSPKPAAPYVASQAAQILSTSAATPPAVEAVADEILEQYRVAPDSMKTDVKKGCFLYFFVALAFLGLGLVALYFVFERGK